MEQKLRSTCGLARAFVNGRKLHRSTKIIRSKLDALYEDFARICMNSDLLFFEDEEIVWDHACLIRLEWAYNAEYDQARRWLDVEGDREPLAFALFRHHKNVENHLYDMAYEPGRGMACLLAFSVLKWVYTARAVTQAWRYSQEGIPTVDAILRVCEEFKTTADNGPDTWRKFVEPFLPKDEKQ